MSHPRITAAGSTRSLGPILAHTTIGVRFAPRDRVTLARRAITVATRYGDIAVKLVFAAALAAALA